MEFANTSFSLSALKALYDYGLECSKLVKQRANNKDYERAQYYTVKQEAILEFLENVTVYHVGDGVNGFNGGSKFYPDLDARLKSFSKLFSKARK